MSYYIYKMYDKNAELLYVGQTISKLIKGRMSSHESQKVWFEEVEKIYYAECQDKFEMDMYEKYYIKTLFPKYNIEYANGLKPRFTLPELDFTEYKKSFFKPVAKELVVKNRKSNTSKFSVKGKLQKDFEFLVYDVNSNKIIEAIEGDELKLIAEQLNVEVQNIVRGLTENGDYIGNYVFIYKHNFNQEVLDYKIGKLKHHLETSIKGKWFEVYNKKTKEYIGEFNSMIEATKVLGITDKRLTYNCLIGRTKSANGYTFKFKE